MREPRAMRRKERRMPPEKARELLEKGEYGVLATADAAGVPLATPLAYVILEDTLYFHCANVGHKLDNIAAQPSVCFCVVGRNNIVYAASFTTHYESALVHGTAAIVQDLAKKQAVLRALCQKYLPQHMDRADEDIQRALAATTVVAIAVEELSGKSNRPEDE